MMNAYNLISGAIHLVSGQFSDYWNFLRFINKSFGHLNYDKEQVSKAIENFVDANHDMSSQMDERSAFNYLVSRDLVSINLVLKKLPSAETLKVNLQKALEKYCDILQELDMNFTPPNLSIVDRFPKPYHNMDWIAFAPDRADQEDFGINPGIYFLESELSPYLSELTLAHELIHSIIGISTPNLLGRGLEEGIAEIMGTLYLGSRLFPTEVIRNVFIHTRFGSDIEQSNSLYLDYSRQASLIYQHFGLDGLVDLMRKGRNEIKKVEERYLAGRLDEVSLKKGNWDNKLSYLIDQLLYCYVPNLFVCPMAAYISNFIEVGLSVNDISVISNVSIENVKVALDELQNQIFAILVDKEKVIYSDLDILNKSKSLHYKVLL